jgi:hypothetical protein
MGPFTNFGLHEMQVVYLMAGQLLTSQTELFSAGLVTVVCVSYKYLACSLLFVSRGTRTHPFILYDFIMYSSVSLFKRLSIKDGKFVFVGSHV